MKPRELPFFVDGTEHEVSALWLCPKKPKAAFVFGHGAGAGMRHKFMEDVAELLAEEEIATFRYQFPYMELGKKFPDHKKTLIATVRSAVKEAEVVAGGLPLFAGGRSMGGRMTSMAQAQEPLDGVQGLIFLGFPLHPAKKPDTKRAEHLSSIQIPMLFVQGTRDALADLSLLTPIVNRLDDLATLSVVEGGDHSFAVLKRSGRNDEEVLGHVINGVTQFIQMSMAS